MKPRHSEATTDTSKLISVLLGLTETEKAFEKPYPHEEKTENVQERSAPLHLDTDFIEMQFKHMLHSSTFQADLMRMMFRHTTRIRKKAHLRAIKGCDLRGESTRSNMPKSQTKLKIIKKAKIKAKQKRSGFRTNIYFQNSNVKDKSFSKTLNNEFIQEISNSLSEAPYSPIVNMQTCKNSNDFIDVLKMGSNFGHIIDCIEAASNGNENGIVFESNVSTAAIKDATEAINITKDSRILLTATHILIGSNDILNSIKLKVASVEEIRIDEFQQMIIINNDIRLFNFHTRNHLQQFLACLEYLIRNMKTQNLSNGITVEKSRDLMRPLTWNEILQTKEIIFFVSLNIPIHSYMYIPSSDKEGGNNDANAVKVSRSKCKGRFEARFKFYKSRNQSVMEVLKLKSCQLDKAYFEVK